MEQKLFHAVGIDVSKKTLSVAVLFAPEFRKLKTKTVSNDENGHVGLIQWLEKQIADDFPFHFIMESTGCYHLPLAVFLASRGCGISVVNPAQVKRFGESTAARTKNDQKDCCIIARFGVLMRPPFWSPPPAEYQRLNQLLQRLEQLDKIIRQEKNRQESSQFGPCPKEVINSIGNLIAYLEKERKILLEQIRNFVENDPFLKEDAKLLKSIPGVGEITALRLASTLEGGHRFRTARQFAAFLGLTPKERKSGTSVRGKTRLSKMGSKELRKAIYMPALVAVSQNPDVRSFYESLISRGKAKMSALGAAMRKLAHIAFGVIKNRTVYVPGGCS